MEISILLPTHNERETAPVLICALGKALKGKEYEIIVVDDGSTDRTALACKLVGEKANVNVKVIERPEKLGLGNAYKKGLEEAKGRYICIMDADLSHDPRDISVLLQKCKDENADVCIGTRYAVGGGVSNWALSRKITSRGANILSKVFTGITATDMTNSYRVYRKALLRSNIKKIGAEGFAYQMEALYRCTDAKIVETPVKFHERVAGTSKLSFSEYIQFIIRGISIFMDRIIQYTKKNIYAETEFF